MRHLSAERLAAVADEYPTPDEAAHLAQCGQCAQGRDAHRRLIAGAALERDRPATPLSEWGAISARLRAEGIIRTPDATITASGDVAPVLPFSRGLEVTGTKAVHAAVPAAAPAPATVRGAAATSVTPMRRRTVPVWAMRAAAGLALVAGGVLAGRASTAPQRVADVTAPSIGSRPPSSGVVAPVSYSPVSQSDDFFRSTAEAQKAMLQAERTYQAAIRYLAANDSAVRPPLPDPVEAYRERLAKLDDAVTATRRALSLSPTNPALNDYYLTSVSARETTLRQIDDALPVTERVTRF